MAIFLSLQWLKSQGKLPPIISCPKKTYVSVPMQIIHSGAWISWRDEDWGYRGHYRLGHTPVTDSARLFTSGMYEPGTLMCTSHHWGKTLGLSQGGCILTDDPDAVEWLRRARFDGRTPGVAPKDDQPIMGWHAYLSPEVAAHGLSKLAVLPRHNKPLPPDAYPDLSKLEVFKPFTITTNHNICV